MGDLCVPRQFYARLLLPSPVQTRVVGLGTRTFFLVFRAILRYGSLDLVIAHCGDKVCGLKEGFPQREVTELEGHPVSC